MLHLSHELILSLQIERGRVDFYRDSEVKHPCLHQVFSLLYQKYSAKGIFFMKGAQAGGEPGIFLVFRFIFSH